MFDRAVVDSVAFAREAGELRGVVAVARIVRLRDALFDDSGEIAYTLTGFTGQQGKPLLRLTVAGEFVLTCQRCLGPLRFRLDSTRDFELVPSGEALRDPAEEAENVEQISADPKLDVTALVEDETILSLPMIASHGPGACTVPAPQEHDAKRQSPFSALTALKRQ